MKCERVSGVMRNKNTGEIAYLLDTERAATLMAFVLDFRDERSPKKYYYRSMRDFYKDWEDYKPTEPKIPESDVEKLLYVVNNGIKLTPELAKRLLNGEAVSFMSLLDFGERVLDVEMKIREFAE